MGNDRSDAVQLGGRHDLRPRGSLHLTGPHDLVVVQGQPGAFRADGPVARRTVRRAQQAANPIGRMPATLDRPAGDVEDDGVLWGGAVIHHYGHFLVECCSMLWPLLEGGPLEGMPVLFPEPYGHSFADEWLTAFGADVRELSAAGAIRCKRMYVADPAWRIDAWIAPEVRDVHLQARRGMDVPPAPSGEVLWLTRSGLRPGRRAFDESLLEWIVRDHVRIVALEEMTLPEQVGEIEGSRAVAGVIGSAFHTLLLARRVPDALYLCPAADRESLPAQHRVLAGRATFVPTLGLVAPNPAARRRREATPFIYPPEGFRVRIPESLAALAATVLPELLDDPRVACFAELEGAAPEPEDALGRSARAVLRDPFSVESRRRLGAEAEEAGLDSLATEQLAMVADLEACPV